MKLPFNVDLNNKVVVITGATGVLGNSWVDAFAECGAKVVILGRNIEVAQ
ncbi:MAG: oxidoreductase, partial [Haloplasmataceae bacterium]|nr:oxidoreductase [Haloplasmataceae bacterium]